MPEQTRGLLIWIWIFCLILSLPLWRSRHLPDAPQHQLHEMSGILLQPTGVVKSVCILPVQISLVLTVFLQTNCCSAEQPANVTCTPFSIWGGWVNYLTCLEFCVLCQHAAHVNSMLTKKITTLIIYYSYLIKKKSDILSNNLRTLWFFYLFILFFYLFFMNDKQKQ